MEQLTNLPGSESNHDDKLSQAEIDALLAQFETDETDKTRRVIGTFAHSEIIEESDGKKYWRKSIAGVSTLEEINEIQKLLQETIPKNKTLAEHTPPTKLSYIQVDKKADKITMAQDVIGPTGSSVNDVAEEHGLPLMNQGNKNQIVNLKALTVNQRQDLLAIAAAVVEIFSSSYRLRTDAYGHTEAQGAYPEIHKHDSFVLGCDLTQGDSNEKIWLVDLYPILFLDKETMVSQIHKFIDRFGFNEAQFHDTYREQINTIFERLDDIEAAEPQFD